MRATVFVHSTRPIPGKKREKIRNRIIKTLNLWTAPPIFYFPKGQKMRGRMGIRLQLLNVGFIAHEPERVRKSFAGHIVDDVNDVYPNAHVQCAIEPWPTKEQEHGLAFTNEHRRKTRIKMQVGKEVW